jgi:hypothetical protein
MKRAYVTAKMKREIRTSSYLANLRSKSSTNVFTTPGNYAQLPHQTQAKEPVTLKVSRAGS